MGSLGEFEDRFRSSGLVSFCRRPHLRPTTFLVFLSAAVVAVEAVLYLRFSSELVVVGSAVVAVSALLAGMFLQRLEYRSDRPFARWLTETAFVVVPAVVVGGVSDWMSGAEVAALNVCMLVSYALEERLGLRFVLAWAARFALSNLRVGWRSLWRTVPLLSLVLVALFFAAETWQVAANAGVGGLLLCAFTLVALSMLIGGLSFGSIEAAGVHVFRRSERYNIVALAAVATGVFSFLAAAAFSVVLLLLGVLLVHVDVLESWLGRQVSAVEVEFVATLTFSWSCCPRSVCLRPSPCLFSLPLSVPVTRTAISPPMPYGPVSSRCCMIVQSICDCWPPQLSRRPISRWLHPPSRCLLPDS